VYLEICFTSLLPTAKCENLPKDYFLLIWKLTVLLSVFTYFANELMQKLVCAISTWQRTLK
jgi:hypothetical protein